MVQGGIGVMAVIVVFIFVGVVGYALYSTQPVNTPAYTIGNTILSAFSTAVSSFIGLIFDVFFIAIAIFIIAVAIRALQSLGYGGRGGAVG
jgi:hypothetical protein